MPAGQASKPGQQVLLRLAVEFMWNRLCNGIPTIMQPGLSALQAALFLPLAARLPAAR